MKVIVQRRPADRQGPDISSSMLISEPAAVARGTVEIDRNCSGRITVTGNSKLIPWLAPGAVVSVTDRENGEYRARVVSHGVVITRGDEGISADSNLVLERVR